MRIRVYLFAAVLALALVGCSKPIPPERIAYVGEWRSPAMSLLITQDGRVKYKRIHGGVTTSVSGPLQKFELAVGKLPFELPSSMDAVREQLEDLPYDSKAPLFKFGAGLSYSTGR